MMKFNLRLFRLIPNKFGQGLCPGCGSDGPTIQNKDDHECCEGCGFNWNEAYLKAKKKLEDDLASQGILTDDWT